MRTWTAALSSVALVLVTSSIAAAQEANASDNAVAEGLFREGKRLMANGEVPAACAKFAESEKLVPKLGTLLNLASCHEKEGKTASAWSEFTDLAAQATRAGQTDRAKYAQEHAQALEQQLAHLVITVKMVNDGMSVKLDGRDVGEAAWGTPIPIDPGDHKIEAAAKGHVPWSGTAHIPQGTATQTIEVPQLDAAAPEKAAETPTAPPPAEDRGKGDAQRTVGIAMIGVGAVAIGVGAYFGVRTFSKESDSNAHCGPDHVAGATTDTQCDTEGKQLRDDAMRSGVISTIAIGAGAALAVGGIVVALTAPHAGKAAPQQGSAWVSPAFGPRGAGLHAGVHF